MYIIFSEYIFFIEGTFFLGMSCLFLATSFFYINFRCSFKFFNSPYWDFYWNVIKLLVIFTERSDLYIFEPLFMVYIYICLFASVKVIH